MSSPPPSDDLERRARRLRWVLSDVDGVLTDGRLHYGDGGETIKVFDVKDGLAVALARRAGLEIGLLTARTSAALERRAHELGLEEVMTGRRDKASAFDEMLARRGVEAAQVGYIGDDLTDLPVLVRAGLSFAPADAAREVRHAVDHRLVSGGGRGALREAVELLLRARGQWTEIVASFGGPETPDVH